MESDQPLNAHAGDAAPQLETYTPVPMKRARHDGWTADRQRTFLAALAESGSIAQACHEAGITARSAYRLRNDPRGRDFAAAWDQALRAATAKLLTLAYERAVSGSYVEHWREGKLVGETRQPSDKILMFLIDRMAPHNHDKATRWSKLETMSREAGLRFSVGLDRIVENDEIAIEELGGSDYGAQLRQRWHEPDSATSFGEARPR